MSPEMERALAEIGVISSQPAPPPIAACYAPPQWKPTQPGEDPPF